MNKKGTRIDLLKMALYILKRIWVLIILAVVGFVGMYWQTGKAVDTYTASGTMYVYNANPNLTNYGYTSASDLTSAVRLVDTYAQVIKSELVLNRVLDDLCEEVINTDGTVRYPEQSLYDRYHLTTSAIAGSITMSAEGETSVVRISCTTLDPQMSVDICNAVLHQAVPAIKEIVGAGEANNMDYAKTASKNSPNKIRQGLTGAMVGAVIGAAILALIFLLNQKVEDPKELTENYTLPVLSTVRRRKGKRTDPGEFILDSNSDMDQVESYAKLRMNLLYTLVGKERPVVEITSAISGEGKSTIAANLAISVAMSGKRVLLVDADMRRACQRDVFHYEEDLPGLSNILIGEAIWRDTLLNTDQPCMQILPAGTVPPNPAELLDSPAMHALLAELEQAYDLVLLDAPPINIVSDPLALSAQVAGGLFVVRQGFSDHREIRKALTAAEMTGLNLLGFIFYGENLKQGSYYNRKYYRGYHQNYYSHYDTRARAGAAGQDTQSVVSVETLLASANKAQSTRNAPNTARQTTRTQ